MTITELMNRLKLLLQEHGDLRVVTPGFDESGYDDVGIVTVTYILPNVNKPGGHEGQHDPGLDYNRPARPKPGAEKVIEVNF